MSRQHSAPLLLTSDGGGAIPLARLGQQTGDTTISEADIQELVHRHPASLPINEIDPMFAGAVPICRELNTPAGPIDNLLLTPSGLPVLVECKLWRNPEGRRAVVGQILDYAKELSRWSSSDLQREVSRRLRRGANPMLDLLRAVDPTLDEMQFNDALTGNLRRGRFLLLIVGDGIREGVEAIAEYLQVHAGLHFSLGLIEMPVYVMPDGNRLVAPRVLARTFVITRNVVELPPQFALQEPSDAAADLPIDAEQVDLGDDRQRFWAAFLADLQLDDPEQPKPKPARLGYIHFYLPAPGGSSSIIVYREVRREEVGVMLSYCRETAGEFAAQAIIDDWEAVKPELGGTARLAEIIKGRLCIADTFRPGPLDMPSVRETANAWLRERLNTFVNVLRPRVRSAVADYLVRKGQSAD